MGWDNPGEKGPCMVQVRDHESELARGIRHGKEAFRFESCYGTKTRRILPVNEGGEDGGRARMTCRFPIC